MAIGYLSIATSTQGTAPRTTGNITFSAGDLLVAGAGWEDAGTLATVSDTVHGGSSGWTIDTLIDGDGARLQVAYKLATSGGTGTATLSFTGGTASFCEAFILAASPPDASPFDKRTVATGSSASMATGTSAAYAQADTLIVGAGKLYNNGNYSGYPTGFVERFDGVGLAVATHNPGATAGINFTITSSVSDAWAVGQWAFKGATSGGQDITGGTNQVPPTGGAATVAPGAVGITGAANAAGPTGGAAAVSTQTGIAGGGNQVAPTGGAAAVTTQTGVAVAANQVPLQGGAAVVAPGGVGIDGGSNQVAPQGGAATVDQAGTQNVAGAATQVPAQGGAASVSPGGVGVAGAANQVPPQGGAAIVSQGGSPQDVVATSTPAGPTGGAAAISTQTGIAGGAAPVQPQGGAAAVTPGAVGVVGGSNQVAPQAGAAFIGDLNRVPPGPRTVVYAGGPATATVTQKRSASSLTTVKRSTAEEV